MVVLKGDFHPMLAQSVENHKNLNSYPSLASLCQRTFPQVAFCVEVLTKDSNKNIQQEQCHFWAPKVRCLGYRGDEILT